MKITKKSVIILKAIFNFGYRFTQHTNVLTNMLREHIRNAIKNLLHTHPTALMLRLSPLLSISLKPLVKNIKFIQNSALRMFLGAFTITLNESLHCLALEPSLVTHRTYLTLTYQL